MDSHLQKIQAFLTTVECGSFTKAADILAYAQSSISKMIADLESEWGVVLIELSAQNAHKHGAWIGICGELAADTTLTETFLRMGIDELSVSAPFVLPLRGTVRALDLSENA